MDRSCFEIRPLLEPGGRLIIADIVQHVGELAVAMAADACDNVIYQQALGVEGDPKPFDVFQQQNWSIFRHPDPADKPAPLPEQLNWLQAVGFVEVDTCWMLAGHAIYGGRKAPGGGRNE